MNTFRQPADKRMAQATVATPGQRLVAGNPCQKFVYTSATMAYPDTLQTAPDDWIITLPFAALNPDGTFEIIPPSSAGTLDDMMNLPVWTTDYRSGMTDSDGGDWLDAFLPKIGKYSAAWIRHDKGYCCQLKSKAETDWQLLQDLQDLGANWFQRNAAWATVKIAGGPIWNAHTPADLLPMQELCKQYQAGWQVQNGVLAPASIPH
jgi:hypothetical protein